MKKLLYLLLLLPFSVLTSCNKEDLAPFDLSLTLGGVTQVNNNFYVVSGDNVTIESLKVDPVGGKNTAVANVMFFIDNAPIFVNPWDAVNEIEFSTANLQPGVHTIGITGNLLQVDQSLQTFAVSYPLVIVEDKEALPADAPETGSYTQTVTIK